MGFRAGQSGLHGDQRKRPSGLARSLGVERRRSRPLARRWCRTLQRLRATLVVPIIIGHGMSSAAALFGAGVGTIVYLLFTKFKSPVFLGSSFAFIGSMGAAFAGAATVALGMIILAVAPSVIISVILVRKEKKK